MQRITLPRLSTRGKKVALAALLVAGAIGQVALVLTESLAFLVRTDDAYYYFEIARNFPRHHTFTFDGLHITNGVQPLWALLLAGVSSVVQALGIQEPVTLVRVFLLPAVLFNVATAWFLATVARTIWGFSTSLLVAFLWLLSPRLVLQQVAGMEGALYAFSLVVLLWFLLNHFAQERLRDYAYLGGLLGFAFLARVDAVLLVPMTALGLGARLGRNRSTAHKLGVMLTIALLVVIPYLVYNVITFGHLFPVSGAVKRYYSESLVASLGGRTSFRFVGFLIKEVLGSLARMIYAVAASPVIESVFFYLLKWRPVDLRAIYRVLASPQTSGVLIIATTLVAAALRSRLSRVRGILIALHRRTCDSRLDFFVAFAIIQFISYVALYPGYLLRSGVQWYFIPSYIVLVLLIARLLSLGLVRGFRWKGLRILVYSVALVVLINLFAFYGLLIRLDFPADLQATAVHAAQWINANTEKEAVIGAFNAGVLGYFTERPVVNLDGMVADYALLDHLEMDTMWTYILSNDINYIADWRPVWRPYSTWLANWGIPIEGAEPVHSLPIPNQQRIYHILRVQ